VLATGSLLRANFNIVFFLFNIVIVRDKYISSSSSSSCVCLSLEHSSD